MRKESVQKFDLEAAFKALDAVEIPVVRGIRPHRDDLQEMFSRKLVTDILLEDYYDVGDQTALNQAQQDREAEIAKAKLARIEKIVDLEAESEEDLLPSYVGKFIMQCPQCMTLFYKNEADIERSEENPEVVNISETCQHCGNTSGYTLIGKVDTVGEEEAAQYDVEDFNETDFDAEELPAEGNETATEEGTDKDLDLAPVEETTEEETSDGEVRESLTEEFDQELEDKLKAHNDYIDYLRQMISEEEKALDKADNEYVKAAIQRRLDAFKVDLEAALPAALQGEYGKDELPTPEDAGMSTDAAENTEEKSEPDAKAANESLMEDIEGERKMAEEEAELNQMNLENDALNSYNVEESVSTSAVTQALNNLEGSLTEGLKLTETADYDVSDAEFKDMLDSPVFKRIPLVYLDENLPPVPTGAFERATSAIQAAGSELTPAELALERQELAARRALKGMRGNLAEDVVEATAAPTSQLKRNYSATELMVKELKAHPLFKAISIRTIQRVLLPYYISVMGRKELSTQAMIDFFTEEGFAPYVLDHFFEVSPLTRKELLKADALFMDIFNKFAKDYSFFPTNDSEREAGESDFDYALKLAFEFDEEGRALDTQTTRDTITAFSRWYAAGEYDKALSADIWESIENFNEQEFNKLTENYLTDVYSNVNTFKTTNCSLENNKLIIEGIITFASGKTKTTTFVYEAKKVDGKNIILEGLNADLAKEKAFILNCNLNSANCLIAESLNYKYTINDTLVEGLLK